MVTNPKAIQRTMTKTDPEEDGGRGAARREALVRKLQARSSKLQVISKTHQLGIAVPASRAACATGIEGTLGQRCPTCQRFWCSQAPMRSPARNSLVLGVSLDLGSWI